MKNYRDLREHLQALEDEHLLQRVTRPINKDTETLPIGSLAVSRRHCRAPTSRMAV